MGSARAGPGSGAVSPGGQVLTCPRRSDSGLHTGHTTCPPGSPYRPLERPYRPAMGLKARWSWRTGGVSPAAEGGSGLGGDPGWSGRWLKRHGRQTGRRHDAHGRDRWGFPPPWQRHPPSPNSPDTQSACCSAIPLFMRVWGRGDTTRCARSSVSATPPAWGRVSRRRGRRGRKDSSL